MLKTPLMLYRRHTKACRDKLSKLDPALSPEAMRFYSGCECPIWITGNTESEFVRRQSTGQIDWNLAEAVRKSMLAAGADEKVRGPRIADSIKTYISSRAEQVVPNRLARYERILGDFREFSSRRGYSFMSEINVDLVERFKSDPGDDHSLSRMKKRRSRQGGLSQLLHFLRTSYKRGWIEKDIAARIEPCSGEESDSTQPLTDAQVAKVLEVAEQEFWRPREDGYTSQPKTFRLLLELMLETGLRCTDAIAYNPKNATPAVRADGTESDFFVYEFEPRKQRRMKKKRRIDIYVPRELKLSIDKCTWLSKESPFRHGDHDLQTLGLQVWYHMKVIGEHCGIEKCKPHALRNTFAVRSLAAGMRIDDLSRLLGHTSVTITEGYYAKWVPSRALRLLNVVEELRTGRKETGKSSRKVAVKKPKRKIA
jgi:integrase